MDVSTIIGNKGLELMKIKDVTFRGKHIITTGVVMDDDGIVKDFALVIDHNIILTNFEIMSCTLTSKEVTA